MNLYEKEPRFWKNEETYWNWDPKGWGLYRPFKIPEYKQQTVAQETIYDFNENPDNNKQELLENNNIFQIAKRLHSNNQLSDESFDKIKDYIYQNNWEISIDKVEINDSEKDLIKWLNKKLEWENKDKNIIDFSEDIKNIDEFKDYDKSMEDWKFAHNNWNFNILNIIWENYIKIPDKQNNSDPKQDISTAIEITKNNILKEIKNLPVDSQTYKTAIENIKSGNLKQQIEWINSLGILAYSREWKLAKKEINSYKEQRKKELQNKAMKITKQLIEARKSNDTKRIEKLELEKQKIIDEANEIESWDIFEWWKNEKINDDDPLLQLEQA